MFSGIIALLLPEILIAMNSSFSYESTYVLDKKHFNECFSQSVPTDTSLKPYVKAIALSMTGLLLLIFSDIDRYLGWFLTMLGIVEALSVYYRKAWWVTRQMLSKAAGNKLTLTIDNEGIKSHSFYVDNTITWQAITQIQTTELGLLIHHDKGVNYLSNSVLSDEAKQHLVAYQVAD